VAIAPTTWPTIRPTNEIHADRTLFFFLSFFFFFLSAAAVAIASGGSSDIMQSRP
jgi:hypothetical protein